jgi:uncharacterized membrane protein AbrB (regulator of aidB expression)
MSDQPAAMTRSFFHACLLILGGMIALSMAVDVLRCIWPWIITALVVAGIVYGVVWWIRQRSGKW